MYLPEALWWMATVTIRPQRTEDEERAQDLDEEKEECLHTIAKDQNELLHQSYQATQPTELPSQNRLKRCSYACG